MPTQANLFFGHGAPDLLSDIPARRFLQELAPRLSTPRGIVMIRTLGLSPQLPNDRRRGTGHPPRLLWLAGGLYTLAYRAAFVAMGAAWSTGYMQQIHHSFSYGNLSMTAYNFAQTAA